MLVTTNSKQAWPEERVKYLQFLPLTMINEEMTQTSNNHLSRGMFSTEGTNDEDRHITTEKFGPCHITTSRPGETYGGSGVFVPTYLWPIHQSADTSILLQSDTIVPNWFRNVPTGQSTSSVEKVLWNLLVIKINNLTLFQIAKWRSCSKLQ